MGAKIDQKSKFFVEFLAKRFQDAPRRPQDVPKMLQDTPRRPKDGPRPPRGRARTAPRRPQTPQDGSKMFPRGARKRPIRPQIAFTSEKYVGFKPSLLKLCWLEELGPWRDDITLRFYVFERDPARCFAGAPPVPNEGQRQS